MINIIVPGLTLGLLSSFHCVGMCGPIALSIPFSGVSSHSRWTTLSFYHAGRIVMYSAMGILLGLAGRGFYLAGFQNGLSVTLGILILLMSLSLIFKFRFGSFRPASAFHGLVLGQMLRVVRKGSLAGFALLGMLNALLPCGMVYIAIAGAMATAEIAEGGLFMFFFGAGTLPALMALSYAGFRASPGIRQKLKAATPVVMGTMGLLLVLRGLNLGIPFVSPFMDSSPSEPIICH